MKLFYRPAAIFLVLNCALLTGLASQASADSPPEFISNEVSQHKAIERAAPPHWAIELTAAPQAFDGKGLLPGHPTAESVSTSLQAEYQPAFIQRFGTLGLGPVFTAYPIGQGQGITSGFFSVWSVGAEAKYQARYFTNQVLVPSVGYEVDRLSYGFTTGQSGAFTLSGPVLGLEFLLNVLDPKHGADFYEASGISHSYLVGELRDLTGTDGAIVASGLSWFLGLRFEM